MKLLKQKGKKRFLYIVAGSKGVDVVKGHHGKMHYCPHLVKANRTLKQRNR